MTSVCYAAPLLDASGYGEASRNAVMALHEAGVDVKTQKISFTGNITYKTTGARIAEELSVKNIPYRVKIIHTTPDVYKDYMEKDKYNIGHLFWETDRLPSGWAESCNLLNEIWTGTQALREVLISSGVTVPISVFPQAVDTSYVRGKPYILPNFHGVVFYSIFDWNERKDPKTLLDAFWKEFKGVNDVCLLIKTQKAGYSKTGADEVISEVKRLKNGLGWIDTPRVFVCTGVLDEEGMRRIHETGDCYVSTSRGEGWCIPIAEASVYRKPVVSAKSGGITEYFLKKHFYEVASVKAEVPQSFNKYYEKGMGWVQTDEADLRATMRKVYDYLVSEKHKGVPQIKAAMAKKLVDLSFNYKLVGQQMKQRLEEIEQP